MTNKEDFDATPPWNQRGCITRPLFLHLKALKVVYDKPPFRKTKKLPDQHVLPAPATG
jgi:hypothetical protein